MRKILSSSDAVQDRTSASALLEREFQDWLARETSGEQAAALQSLFRQALLDPAQEFLDRPGKQFRGRLVTRAWAMAGGSQPSPVELPLIVEVLHAGSLIIDDIQDDSILRRGAPALHHLSGTPSAINTANFFYCWSLDMLGRLDLPEGVTLRLYRRASSTLLRCHRGQALDLSVRVCDLAQDRVAVVVDSAATLKAGALMEFAASLGATAAGALTDEVDALATFGGRLGVALQRLDDLTGITNRERRSKGLEDLRLSRLSWVWAWLAHTTDAQTFARHRRQAVAVAEGSDPEPLAESLRGHMTGARHEICQRVLAALDRLQAQIGDGPHIEALRAELDLLERSYV